MARSICRWTRDGGWQRPVFAPRATDTVPAPARGQEPKLRLLTERLYALAERYVRELEESENVDPDKLVQALEVVKIARLEAMGRRRRRRIHDEPRTGAQWTGQQEAIRAALKDCAAAASIIDRAPPAAVADFVESTRPHATSRYCAKRAAIRSAIARWRG